MARGSMRTSASIGNGFCSVCSGLNSSIRFCEIGAAETTITLSFCAVGRAQPSQDVPARQVRQVDVEDHRVRPGLRHLQQRRLGGRRDGDIVVPRAEVAGDHVSQRGFVFDKQDSHDGMRMTARVREARAKWPRSVRKVSGFGRGIEEPVADAGIGADEARRTGIVAELRA